MNGLVLRYAGFEQELSPLSLGFWDVESLTQPIAPPGATHSNGKDLLDDGLAGDDGANGPRQSKR